MRKLIASIFIFSIFVFGFSVNNASAAVNIVDSGKCGDDVYWQLSEDGELHIYGTGIMYDYMYSSKKNIKVPWNRYSEDIITVEIDSGVTSIGASAFENCYSLESIIIPDTVISIGDYSLTMCGNLNEIIVDEANPEYTAIDNVLFSKDKAKLITCAKIKREYM